MKRNFWLIFAVDTASAAAEALVGSSTLTDQQKKALADLIAAAAEVTSTF